MKCSMCLADPMPGSTCMLEGFSDNWNCGTLNALRSICSPDMNSYNADAYYLGDDRIALIRLDDVIGVDGLALWVRWYKSRGRTDEVLLMTYRGPRTPSEKELLKIIKYHRSKLI